MNNLFNLNSQLLIRIDTNKQTTKATSFVYLLYFQENSFSFSRFFISDICN